MLTRISTLAFVLCFVPAIACAGDDPNQSDLAKLHGTWTMVSGERGGAALPDSMIKTGKRVCKDDEVTVEVGGMVIVHATVKLDATTNPKSIEYHVISEDPKGLVQLGIYEITGDTVKFCFANPDKERPTGFTTKAGSGWTSSVWKRNKK